MVSAGAPHWRGAQAQWLYECGCRLLLMILIPPSSVSPGVHPHRDLPSCHQPRLDKMVSAGAPQWRGTHGQWLIKRLNPVPVVIGDFDGLSCGSALLAPSPWFEVPPTPAFLGVGPIGFWLPLARFLVPEVFVAGLCSCLSSAFPLSLDSFPVLNNNIVQARRANKRFYFCQHLSRKYTDHKVTKIRLLASFGV